MSMSIRLPISMSYAEYDYVNQQANKQHISRAEFIRRLINKDRQYEHLHPQGKDNVGHDKPRAGKKWWQFLGHLALAWLLPDQSRLSHQWRKSTVWVDPIIAKGRWHRALSTQDPIRAAPAAHWPTGHWVAQTKGEDISNWLRLSLNVWSDIT